MAFSCPYQTVYQGTLQVMRIHFPDYSFRAFWRSTVRRLAGSTHIHLEHDWAPIAPPDSKEKWCIKIESFRT